MSEPDIPHAVDLLRCAEVNCGNVIGGDAEKQWVLPSMVQVVKLQIQQAIRALGEEPGTPDVDAPERIGPQGVK